MKFGIVIFPGSNGDDVHHVLHHVMEQEAEKIWHKEGSLSNFDVYDCVILPGGFAFGDYLRPGALAGCSPIVQSVIDFARQGGLVWGIGNGFQILCEAGLLPGKIGRNEPERFICKNACLKAMTRKTALTSGMDLDETMNIPVAHAYGRYFAEEQTLDELEANDQVLLKYCTAGGMIIPEANIDGTTRNIAGVCNAGRNVFGTMPHPERAAESDLGNTDGRVFFESLIASNEMSSAV